jgi:hypothetical protein
MLSQTFFDRGDADRLQSSYKKFRLISYLLLIIGIPVEVLIGYVASLGSAEMFWPISLLGLAILLFGFYIVFFKRLKSIRQDLAEHTKMVGILQVISKSEKDKQLFVGFESDELNQIVLGRPAFDRINIGDNLSIEFSKYSKYIFKISRSDEIIKGN